MSRNVSRHRKQGEWWAMACYSLLLHLSLYFFILNAHFSHHVKEAPVYYVDVINLPVASPQAGTPGEAGSSSSPPQPATPRKQEMVVPPQPAAKTPARVAPVTPPKPPVPEETSREFDERMARLEQAAAARHQAEAVEALRKRSSVNGGAGMPGAAGTEAGSSYASYIQSRLTDAFKTTIALQTKSPEVAMRITIGRNGRIVKMRMERTTGDRVFEDAVSRAIAKAEKTFPPPPTHEEFETGFIFRPQGVGKR